MDTPFLALFTTVDRAGIWFPYKGDEVLWTWPWRRDRGDGWKGGPFISVGFSGTGEFGDARFNSLKELDEMWDDYFNAEKRHSEFMSRMEISTEWSSTDAAGFAVAEDVKAGDLVALNENDEVIKAFARDAGMSPDEVASAANKVVKKFGLFPHDEMKRLGEAFDKINERT